MKRFYVAPRTLSFDEHLRHWAQNAERRFEARALKGSAKMEAGGADVEFSIMDVIGIEWISGSITSQMVDEALRKHPNAQHIRVLLNSPGGYCSEGTAIYNLFARHPAKVEVEVVGEAASAASVIAMAGDRIIMRPGTWMMVHPAQVEAFGSAADMRKAAEYADTCTAGAVDIYVRRTGLGEKKVRELVDAETWMTAAQAVGLGFADEVVAGAEGRPDASEPGADDEPQQVDVNIHVTTNQRRLVAMQSLRGYGRGRNILG
jgi:ATP-dependent Clp protease protease subunit